MKIKRIIGYAYGGLTLIATLMCGVTTARLIDILPALLLMWITYLFFLTGHGIIRSNVQRKREESRLERRLICLLNGYSALLLIVCAVFAVSIAHFYTGQTPLSLLEDLAAGRSTYARYQAYSASRNLGEFSVGKIPFVLMNYLLNFIILLTYVEGIIFRERIELKRVLFLICIGSTNLYYGFARGTNFELFLLVFLTVFCILYRPIFHGAPRMLSIKVKIGMLLMLLMALILFENVVLQRFSQFGYSISADIIFDPNEVISSDFPKFGLLIARISQYFGVGSYYVSAFLNHVWLSSWESFIFGLIPGTALMYGSNLPWMINQHVDLSSNWVPDIVGLIGEVGLLGVFFVVAVMGYMTSRLAAKGNFVSILLLYFITLQMFSLFVGNFVVVLSANRLIVLTLVCIALWEKVGGKLRHGSGPSERIACPRK